MEYRLRHQNFMLAVRREMGWPPFKPSNDAIAFCSGRKLDVEVGMEMARIAQTLRKDAVYGGWSSASAAEPDGFAIVFREMLTVDVIDRCLPFAADETAPIVFISTRADEHFAVDARGSLSRVPSKPDNLGKGRKLAPKRIRTVAATMGDELLPSNRWGADRRRLGRA